jgi:flagellar hook-associated protein 1
MSIGAALSIASIEVGNIGAQFAVIGHNIANASTPNYSAEELQQNSVVADGVGMGARNGVVQRAVDQQGQADLLSQNGSVSSLQAQQAALQLIDAVEGAVGSGMDIGSSLGALTNAFSTLAQSPDNQTQQQRVVDAAQQLATQINSLNNSATGQRQTAQETIVSNVAQLNASLANIGELNDQIVSGRTAGSSTADLENQRDATLDELSKLVSVKFLDQSDGSLLAMTDAGLSLPLHGGAAPFVTTNAIVATGSYAPGGGLPSIALNGQDITAQLTGGQLGGNLVLRDRTLPTIQANLDEFAQRLTGRFDAQGLTLFTDIGGNVPLPGGMPVQAGYIGYAGAIQVNPTVSLNPALTRDGTHGVTAGTGGATGFTPNPAGGPAGYTTLIDRIVQYALGGQASSGVPQTLPATTGLGPSGTLTSGFAAPADLAGLAAAVTGQEAELSASTTNQLTVAQSTQTMLQANLFSATSVSIDSEMSRMIVLQNAYGANAHVMSVVQSMWAQLLQAIQ